MAYTYDFGAIEESIVKQSVQANTPIPEKILNAPELLQGLELYFNAFFDLDSERSHALAPTAIPWSSINKYAEVHDFSHEQRLDLFFFIKRMDHAHLKRVKKNAESK